MFPYFPGKNAPPPNICPATNINVESRLNLNLKSLLHFLQRTSQMTKGFQFLFLSSHYLIILFLTSPLKIRACQKLYLIEDQMFNRLIQETGFCSNFSKRNKILSLLEFCEYIRKRNKISRNEKSIFIHFPPT